MLGSYFENSSQGKFMLNIIFGYSKYYVDSLSENVKRGMRTKLQKGWQPNLAPIGYKNCPETKTIISEEEHFNAVRGMFDLLLSGHHSPISIHRIVCNQWNYITPLRKKTGGKHPAVSTVYKILSNPFYAGFIRWKGQLYSGSHISVVTKAEFEKAQILLGHKLRSKPIKHKFSYTGLFTCGACGKSVTAERKRKKSGREYTYYHCTRIHTTPKCQQPSIEVKALEQQITEFLDRLVMPTEIFKWLVSAIKNSSEDMAHETTRQAQKYAEASSNIEKQLSNLTDLRLRDIVNEDEFTQRREVLQVHLAAAEEKADKSDNQQSTIEPSVILGFLLARAKYWFSVGDKTQRKKLLQILCSNPTIKDRKALLTPKFPLLEVSEIFKFPRLRGHVGDGRTTSDGNYNISQSQITRLQRISLADDCGQYVKNIRALAQEIEPTALQQLDLELRTSAPTQQNNDRVPIDYSP